MAEVVPEDFGRYQVLERLGSGGMADVFRAREDGSDVDVCLKRIRREHLQDRAFVDMFIHEARISALLKHPNVVQVYETGEVGGEFFMTMELIRGRDLLKIMRVTGAPLPPAAAALIARDVAKALAYAHELTDERGELLELIHRDVSLQNVMIGFDGGVKLVDFGVAKAVYGAGPGTQTGVVKGKFAYLAPEQLRGVKASPRTDIFALGVVLWEMLTGDRLFHTKNIVETLTRLRNMPIPRPSQRNPLVPAALDRVVGLALERDPSSRYGRAAVLARDLDSFCTSARATSADLKSMMARAFSLPDVNPEEGPFEGTQANADPYGSTSAASPAAAADKSVSMAIEAVSDSMLIDVNDLPFDSPARDDLPATMIERAPNQLAMMAAMMRARSANEASPAGPMIETPAVTLVDPPDEHEPLVPPEPPEKEGLVFSDRTSISERRMVVPVAAAGPPPPAPWYANSDAPTLVPDEESNFANPPQPAVPSAPSAPFRPAAIAPTPMAIAPTPMAIAPTPRAIAPTPVPIAPTPMYPAAPMYQAAPQGYENVSLRPSGTRWVLIALGFVVVLAGAGIAAWQFVLSGPAPSAAARSLRLISIPSGANVYEGSKLLGVTPMDINFADGSDEITISVFKKMGGSEQHVTLTPKDAPLYEVRLPEE